MQCKVMFKRNQVAVVSYRDEVGRYQGRVIPQQEIHGTRSGEMVEIERVVLDRGIEYGLDFNVVLGGAITLYPNDIQNAFRAHGIWTEVDLILRPQEATAACASLVHLVYGQIVKAVQDALGGR